MNDNELAALIQHAANMAEWLKETYSTAVKVNQTPKGNHIQLTVLSEKDGSFIAEYKVISVEETNEQGEKGVYYHLEFIKGKPAFKITIEDVNPENTNEIAAKIDDFTPKTPKITIELKEHEEIPIKYIYTDHSNPVQTIFGTYGNSFPLNGKIGNIATEKEFTITEIDGKKIRQPKKFLLSAEIVNKALSEHSLNPLDQAVYNLVSSTYLAGNNYFTLPELWGAIFDPYSCKGTTAERLRESIEKLSSIRIQAETTDNNGNPVKINQNLLYTRAETRIQAGNKKAVTGYLLLAAPAFNELTQLNNQYFSVDRALYDYGSKGKQIRAFLIVCAFLRRIELQKYTYKSEIEQAKRKALSKAKSDEKNKANAEGRAASNKHLDTYKYYTAPAERFRTVKINFDELCKEVECTDNLSKIGKNVRATIKKEVELCLNYYKEIGYIESFELPAANHNKTAEVIIKLNKDINKPYVITDSRAKQRERAKEESRCK